MLSHVIRMRDHELDHIRERAHEPSRFTPGPGECLGVSDSQRLGHTTLIPCPATP
jgi:hypothetical protein